jgi:hypothetical protein
LKAKLFAIASSLATFVLAVVFQQTGFAADSVAPSSTSFQSVPAPDSPKIKFLRPLTNEVYSNAPFYIQVTVDSFKLVPPGQPDQTQSAGYIRYTLDDFPVVCTKATQIMVNKNLGHGYVPTGKHYLRAELVDSSDHSLNPPVIADTQFWSVHPAYVEETRAGVGASPTQEDQLRDVQRELDEVQQHLLKLESGDTGYEPRPMVRRTTTNRPTVPKTNVNSKVTQ